MEKNKKKKAIADAGLTIVDSAVTLFTQVSMLQLGSAFKQAYSSIKEELFHEKLAAFFENTKNIPKADIESFLSVLENDKDVFFKRLFVLLDRLDDKQKA